MENLTSCTPKTSRGDKKNTVYMPTYTKTYESNIIQKDNQLASALKTLEEQHSNHEISDFEYRTNKAALTLAGAKDEKEKPSIIYSI